MKKVIAQIIIVLAIIFLVYIKEPVISEQNRYIVMFGTVEDYGSYFKTYEGETYEIVDGPEDNGEHYIATYDTVTKRIVALEYIEKE